MKSSFKYLAAAAVVAGVAFQAPAADSIREVKIIEDTDPNKMTTKIYELKYTIASDLTPYVQNAVSQMDGESKVDRVNFSAEGKQLLVVSMWDEIVPMVDDLVAKLDRPGFIDNGSHDFIFYPTYRSMFNLSELFDKMYNGNEGKYRHQDGWVLRWKDSKSDGSGAMKILKQLDKPVPQVNLSFTVYEVNDNDLKDVGVDYASWMNGPGLELFNFRTADYSGDSTDQDFEGGSFAPSIDFSFIRLLQQRGVAKVATTANLTVRNGAAPSSVSFGPNLQSIQKDGNQRTVGTVSPGFTLELGTPQLYLNKTQTGTDYMIYDWKIDIQSIVETTATGAIMNQQIMRSTEEMVAGEEKVLVSFNREHDVEQFVGVPFLSEIPYVKYLFGTETTSKANTTVIVTVKAEDVSSAAKTYVNKESAALVK